MSSSSASTSAASSILERIFAAKRVELEAERAARSRSKRYREAARRAPAPRDFVGRAPRAPAGDHRRDQTRLAEQGRYPARPRPGHRRARLCACGRGGDFGPDRPALSKARLTICGRCARRSIYRCCARTLSSIAYQLYEARAAGADCILLIAAMLKDEELRALSRSARELGLAALVEVHNRDELRIARARRRRNARNQQPRPAYFRDRYRVTEQLLAGYGGDALIVSESGIETPADIRRLDGAGARAFLIGESLLRGGDPRRSSALCSRTRTGSRASGAAQYSTG